MLVTVAGIVTLRKLVQPLNVNLEIDVIRLEIVTEVRAVQLKNAESPR